MEPSAILGLFVADGLGTCVTIKRGSLVVRTADGLPLLAIEPHGGPPSRFTVIPAAVAVDQEPAS